jgi:hypothetical protein
MRALVRTALPLAALACATPIAHHVDERPAGYAHPEPDPTCRGFVSNALAVNGLEAVTARVALTGKGATVELLAPELTPAQAEEVRRAFAECAWRPGEGGARSGTVTFTRP